jgi:D-sedoheptulose 7-phosphate isomerase
MQEKTCCKIETIKSRINETIQVLEEVRNNTDIIKQAAKLIISAFKDGKKLLICGNGGSAADAQHIAAEFVGKFYRIDRPALPAIALNTNTSIITAIGNDFGYDKTFVRQVEALGGEGDVLVSISTSGNSVNAIEATKLARQKGMKTISLTGEGGGALKDISDLTIAVPSKNTPIIQNAHITICHIICEIVEKAF